jgi:hypothetical protein
MERKAAAEATVAKASAYNQRLSKGSRSGNESERKATTEAAKEGKRLRHGNH